jgi:hypothetical protein
MRLFTWCKILFWLIHFLSMNLSIYSQIILEISNLPRITIQISDVLFLIRTDPHFEWSLVLHHGSLLPRAQIRPSIHRILGHSSDGIRIVGKVISLIKVKSILGIHSLWGVHTARIIILLILLLIQR